MYENCRILKILNVIRLCRKREKSKLCNYDSYESQSTGAIFDKEINITDTPNILFE